MKAASKVAMKTKGSFLAKAVKSAWVYGITSKTWEL
jgi:hypothetical protein